MKHLLSILVIALAFIPTNAQTEVDELTEFRILRSGFINSINISNIKEGTNHLSHYTYHRDTITQVMYLPNFTTKEERIRLMGMLNEQPVAFMGELLTHRKSEITNAKRVYKDIKALRFSHLCVIMVVEDMSMYKSKAIKL